MRKLSIAVLMILLVIESYCQNSQSTMTDQSHDPEWSDPLPKEKIFLHLDRPDYMQGDTIWFKAYGWFGFDQLPDTVSKILHVELVTSKDSVLMRKKLLLQNGTSKGEFCLDKNTEPGKYVIRAYTRWMQNEHTGEPFYQVFSIGSLKQNFHVECIPRIIRQKERDSLKIVLRYYEINEQGDLVKNFNHKVNYRIKIGDRLLNTERALSSEGPGEQILKFPLPDQEKADSSALLNISINESGLEYHKQFSIPLADEPDLQFFPEGGSLIDGIRSRVVFKVIGTDGLGRDVKGIIQSDDGNEITPFESSVKGMGDFYFTPEKGKKYQAFVNLNRKTFKFSLPEVKEQGMGMTLVKNLTEWTADIRYSPALENKTIYLSASSYGKLRFVSPLKLSPDSLTVKIPLTLLTEGITQLTLLNDSFRPVCERLIYTDKRERIKVEIRSDSVSYPARSKVTLHILTTTQNGDPAPANLSLSVIDLEQVSGNDSMKGISSYKLLNSELRGSIEDPGFYFRGDSLNCKAMDLLLLTQGYRTFLPFNAKPAEINYYPERAFEISGKVAFKSEKGKPFNYNSLGLNLLCPSAKTYFDQTRPDSTGHFVFQIPLLEGKPVSLLKAYIPNGKFTREKLPKEKSFRGDILLDESTEPKFKLPVLPEKSTATPVTEWVRQFQTAKKIDLAKANNGDLWHLSLPEVTVTGKAKRDKDWYTHYEEEAKKIVDMDSIDPTGRKYGNVYDLLIREFGAREYRLPGFKTVHLPSVGHKDWYFPIYLLNGSIYFNGGEDEDETGKSRQADPDSGYAGNSSGQIGEEEGESHSNRYMTLLQNLSVIKTNEIRKIMVLPPGNIPFHYADPVILMPPVYIHQSMVVLETYSNPNFYRGDPDGIKTFILDGLDSPRKFYSPKYEGANKDSPNYDGRATLYWNPDILTDEKGESQVEFFTGDRRTRYEVMVNGTGIQNGKTGEVRYLIK